MDRQHQMWKKWELFVIMLVTRFEKPVFNEQHRLVTISRNDRKSAILLSKRQFCVKFSPGPMSVSPHKIKFGRAPNHNECPQRHRKRLALASAHVASVNLTRGRKDSVHTPKQANTPTIKKKKYKPHPID